MLHTKYQGSKPYGFRQYFFHVFPYKGLVKHVTQGQAIFGPRDILTNLVEVY